MQGLFLQTLTILFIFTLLECVTRILIARYNSININGVNGVNGVNGIHGANGVNGSIIRVYYYYLKGCKTFSYEVLHYQILDRFTV